MVAWVIEAGDGTNSDIIAVADSLVAAVRHVKSLYPPSYSGGVLWDAVVEAEPSNGTAYLRANFQRAEGKSVAYTRQYNFSSYLVQE